MGFARPGMRITPGSVSMSVSTGITFSSMAADAVTTLKVEPGSYTILDGAVAPNHLVELPIDVRIEGRRVRHRQNLAGLRIHDDGAAAPRAIGGDAGFELALGDVLEVLVDRQLDASSRWSADARTG